MCFNYVTMKLAIVDGIRHKNVIFVVNTVVKKCHEISKNMK